MFSQLLIDTAQVYRREGVNDGLGSTQSQYTLLIDNAVRCRVGRQSKTARNRAVMDGKDVTIDIVTIFTDPRNDLKARDRFVIGGRFYDTYDAYPVQDSTGAHHLEFTARLVT